MRHHLNVIDCLFVHLVVPQAWFLQGFPPFHQLVEFSFLDTITFGLLSWSG